jgi:hypothetical protein
MSMRLQMWCKYPHTCTDGTCAVSVLARSAAASHKSCAGEDGYIGNMCMAPWADVQKPMLRLPTVNVVS